jgi:tetratricopeptide (TPR) repeat protein
VIRTFIAIALLAGVSKGFAHPEIEDALIRLNAQIAAEPENAELYLQRGELYARHNEWIVAEANFLHAAELAPGLPRLPRARGALELATGRAAEARRHLDAALARDAQDAEALVLRARAHAAMQLRQAAVDDLNAALALIKAPPPELYLERAALLGPAEAIGSLDEGLARLGPVISLQLRALALEESLGRIDAAVLRLDRIIAETERKETWLKRRGDLLTRAGRIHDARATYRSALTAIHNLPDWLAASPETQQLLAELTHLTASRS